MAGNQTGAQSGNTVDPLGPFTIAFTNTSYEVAQALSTGSNTVNVPITAGGVVINPPSTNTETLQLGSLGYIDPASPTLWNFDANHVPSSFTITAAGAVTVVFRFI